MPLKSATPSKSDLGLKRAYKQYNRLYFDGELPDASVWWEPPDGAYGDCNFVDGGFRIRLNPSISGWTEIWKVALLHECIHVRLWPNIKHSTKFDREVQRLLQFKAIRKLFV